MSTPTTPNDLSTVLAREPCVGCGAPLGADQRYCLSCGVPRASTRLPFLDVLHAEAASAHQLRAPALVPVAAQYGGRGGETGFAGRLRENSGVLALAGVLLLALLIGLLLGHWVSGSAREVASAPAKQVIEYRGNLPVAAAPAAPSEGAAAPSAAATNATTGSSGEGAASSKSTAHASNPTVSKLAHSTGKEHEKEVEKAIAGGHALSTGGAPPPKETNSKKPVGGGSPVTTIE